MHRYIYTYRKWDKVSALQLLNPLDIHHLQYEGTSNHWHKQIKNNLNYN